MGKKKTSMKIIVASNEKGGVGKTTIARHLAYRLIEEGARVLLVDLDPQGNFSRTFTEIMFVNSSSDYSSSADLFDRTPTLVIQNAHGCGLLPSARETLVANQSLSIEDFSHVKANLDALRDKYDYCIIDTSPHAGGINIAALTAADAVIVPHDLTEDSRRGLINVSDQVSYIRQEGWNPNLFILGILVTNMDKGSPKEIMNLEADKASFGDLVFQHIMYRRRVLRYTDTGPGWASGGVVATEIKNVVDEIIKRLNKKVTA